MQWGSDGALLLAAAGTVVYYTVRSIERRSLAASAFDEAVSMSEWELCGADSYEQTFAVMPAGMWRGRTRMGKFCGSGSGLDATHRIIHADSETQTVILRPLDWRKRAKKAAVESAVSAYRVAPDGSLVAVPSDVADDVAMALSEDPAPKEITRIRVPIGEWCESKQEEFTHGWVGAAGRWVRCMPHESFITHKIIHWGEHHVTLEPLEKEGTNVELGIGAGLALAGGAWGYERAKRKWDAAVPEGGLRVRMSAILWDYRTTDVEWVVPSVIGGYDWWQPAESYLKYNATKRRILKRGAVWTILGAEEATEEEEKMWVAPESSTMDAAAPYSFPFVINPHYYGEKEDPDKDPDFEVKDAEDPLAPDNIYLYHMPSMTLAKPVDGPAHDGMTAEQLDICKDVRAKRTKEALDLMTGYEKFCALERGEVTREEIRAHNNGEEFREAAKEPSERHLTDEEKTMGVIRAWKDGCFDVAWNRCSFSVRTAAANALRCDYRGETWYAEMEHSPSTHEIVGRSNGLSIRLRPVVAKDAKPEVPEGGREFNKVHLSFIYDLEVGGTVDEVSAGSPAGCCRTAKQMTDHYKDVPTGRFLPVLAIDGDRVICGRPLGEEKKEEEIPNGSLWVPMGEVFAWNNIEKYDRTHLVKVSDAPVWRSRMNADTVTARECREIIRKQGDGVWVGPPLEKEPEKPALQEGQEFLSWDEFGEATDSTMDQDWTCAWRVAGRWVAGIYDNPNFTHRIVSNHPELRLMIIEKIEPKLEEGQIGVPRNQWKCSLDLGGEFAARVDGDDKWTQSTNPNWRGATHTIVRWGNPVILEPIKKEEPLEPGQIRVECAAFSDMHEESLEAHHEYAYKRDRGWVSSGIPFAESTHRIVSRTATHVVLEPIEKQMPGIPEGGKVYERDDLLAPGSLSVGAYVCDLENGKFYCYTAGEPHHLYTCREVLWIEGGKVGCGPLIEKGEGKPKRVMVPWSDCSNSLQVGVPPTDGWGAFIMFGSTRRWGVSCKSATHREVAREQGVSITLEEIEKG